MRNRGWSAIALAVLLPAMVVTASCAKKNVVQSQTASMAGPEVQKAPDRPAEEAGKDGRLEDRTRTEAVAREAAARQAALTAFLGENIHFAFDSFLLTDQARRKLTSKAEYLRANPDVKVTVEGHCDDRGTSAYNIALGARRAESAKMFLVNLGIATDRLNTVSYGEERPIAAGHDEASWAENRRAQFVIQ